MNDGTKVTGEAHAGLARLERRIARDLECLSYPDKPWVEPVRAPDGGPDGTPALDCAVIGGGQFGLAVTFGLRREKVDNVAIFDRSSAGHEGPWVTFARMNMLRTPKDLTGPDLGIGSLTFRAWYEAQYGTDGWDRLVRIPPAQWMDYLRWYRATLRLDVRNDAELLRIEPLAGDLFRLTFDIGGARTIVHARTVVLATGAEGSGARYLPPFITDSLPRHLYAHTNDAIDPAALTGKRVGILGAGASAFDYAAAALEAGATEARLFFRRPSLPLQNPRRWMEFSGFLAHYPELPDAQRWAYMHRLFDISQPPPVPTFQRATALPGFAMHPGTPWRRVASPDGKTVLVETAQARFTFDYVMAATGMVVDLSLRPELAEVAPHVALWSDRYAPPAELQDSRLALFPYLGRYCDFQEKTPGQAAWLARIFTITRGSTMSMGPSAASNSNMKYTAPRIVAGVVRQLFLDRADAFHKAFAETTHNELDAGRVQAARTGS
jgi:cation diffusion facilitator CzcD-associated flavoprotein CzcO